MCPVDRMMMVTASPAHAAFPNGLIAPPYFWFTIGAAVAKKMRMNVPTNSAPSCTHTHTHAHRHCCQLQELHIVASIFFSLKKKETLFANNSNAEPQMIANETTKSTPAFRVLKRQHVVVFHRPIIIIARQNPIEVNTAVCSAIIHPAALFSETACAAVGQ